MYASGIPQNSLSKWYGQTFRKEGEKKRDIVSTDIIETFGETNSFLMESIHSFDSAIENFGDNQKKEAQASIQRYQSEKRSKLEQTVSDLQNISFDDYVENVKLDGEIDSEIHNILTEVFSH